MDAQELRILQEAYMEVVANQQLDEGRKKIKIHTNKPIEYKIADIGPGKKEYNVKTSKGWKEQVDLYDIILSHLLDEGYAETIDAAEVIMVNMSEEWREDIIEGYKPLPKGKIDRKIASKGVKAAKHYFASTWGSGDKSAENLEKANKLSSQAGKLLQISTERAPEASSRSRGIKSKFEKEKRDKAKRYNELVSQKKKEYEEREKRMKGN